LINDLSPDDDEATRFLYIELDIDQDFNFDEEISVSDILATSISKEIGPNGAVFDFNRSSLCEDIPCGFHNLNLLATVDFDKVLVAIKPACLKTMYECAVDKIEKLWNLSNRSIKASDFIFSILGE